jgi:hypothetical protein
MWGAYNRYFEEHTTARTDFPAWINWPANLFFGLKVATLVYAYLRLLMYLELVIHGQP